MGTPAEIRETSCGSRMGYFKLGDYWPVSVGKLAPRRFKHGGASFLWFPFFFFFFGSCLAKLVFVKTTVETLNALRYWNVLRRCLGSTDDFGIWNVSVFSRQICRIRTHVLVRKNGEGGYSLIISISLLNSLLFYTEVFLYTFLSFQFTGESIIFLLTLPIYIVFFFQPPRNYLFPPNNHDYNPKRA